METKVYKPSEKTKKEEKESVEVELSPPPSKKLKHKEKGSETKKIKELPAPKLKETFISELAN